MQDRTIGDGVTMSDGGTTVLAGRYRVVRPLGRGGMGSVWLAEDRSLDGRFVAVKMLPSVLVSNRRAYEQLKSEAKVSLRLTHPNIAVLRSFEENDGNSFLVIDYIDGITLDDYLAEYDSGAVGAERRPYHDEEDDTVGAGNRSCGDEEGRAVAPRPPHACGLPEADVIRLLTPVAAALDYAHAQGVVHRDIKPGNVMIAKDGTPFVLDFGIAREIQETLTRVTGKLSSGTLPYMSPEQLNGAAAKPTQDVYSFAAMVYECLTGRPPFSRGQIEFQIEHETPEPLSPEIGIREAVMAGLAKTGSARPRSCADVLLSGHRPSVSAPKERPQPHRFVFQRVRDPWYARFRLGRERLPWIAAGLSVMFLFSVLGVRAYRQAERRRAREAAVMAERARAEAEERTEALRQTRVREAELRRRTESRLQTVVKEETLAVERKKTERLAGELAEAAGQCLARCREMNGEDGLSLQIVACSDVYDEAKRRFLHDDLSGAISGYSNVIARCTSIEKLGQQRDEARSCREKMADAAEKAKGARDKTNLQQAESARRQGETAFAGQRFDEATAAFSQAESAYVRAIETEAKVKAELAQRAVERKRKEEAEKIAHAQQIEAYRRKHYPECYEKSPLSDLEPITYFKEDPNAVRPVKSRKRRNSLKPPL